MLTNNHSCKTHGRPWSYRHFARETISKVKRLSVKTFSQTAMTIAIELPNCYDTIIWGYKKTTCNHILPTYHTLSSFVPCCVYTVRKLDNVTGKLLVWLIIINFYWDSCHFCVANSIQIKKCLFNKCTRTLKTIYKVDESRCQFLATLRRTRKKNILISGAFNCT